MSCLQEAAHIREVLPEEVLKDVGVHLVPWHAGNKVLGDIVVNELYQTPEGILGEGWSLLGHVTQVTDFMMYHRSCNIHVMLTSAGMTRSSVAARKDMPCTA